jgi:predicted SnoaL-like aldol condensation-catalyzing enzyme
MSQVESVSEVNKQKVRLFVDAVLNAGRLELIDQLIAADYLGHMRCLARTVIGPEGVRRLVSSHRRAHPGLQIRIAELVAEDDRVVVRWQASASLPGMRSARGGSAPCSEGLSIIRLLAGKQVDSHTECADLASTEGPSPPRNQSSKPEGRAGMT